MSASPSSPSSRRSSHSTHPPRWRRTISATKSQQPASISLVYAQPEQGSKLRSAIDQLPAHALDDNSSSSSIMSKKRERLSSTSTAGRETDIGEGDVDRKRTRTQSAAAQHLSPALIPPPEEEAVQILPIDDADSPTAPSDALTSPPPTTGLSTETAAVSTEAVPFPSSEREPKQLSTRSSWFGSLSRARGKDTVRSEETQSRPTAEDALKLDLDKVNEQPRTEPVSSQGGQKDPSAESDTARPQSITMPRPPVQASQATPSPSSPGLPTISASGIGASPSLMSVDEEVPRARLATDSPPMEMLHAQVQPQDDLSMGRKPSMSDLNPSTSRFTLRIPLLGRPKVPLQQAVKSAEVSAQLDGATSGRIEVAKDGVKDAAGQLQSSTSAGEHKVGESNGDSVQTEESQPPPGTPLPTKIERAMMSSIMAPDPEPPSSGASATEPSPARSPVSEAPSPELSADGPSTSPRPPSDDETPWAKSRIRCVRVRRGCGAGIVARRAWGGYVRAQ
ncbi:uncharacterized protein B0H18DRAFT_1153679 [Fomitopsis serialis]|uniref:uncharacterized protein n=1 Tax=Fomitopsis serialis TaxID=139415 RepID=UPI002008A3E1|nr:uncharacterized protein B0H18DRAFT_1153679 [Neoantrodia serialis]KAH9913212.1 hypothetical protein B0H18DRAFT_1153679 [Neoantrodia serialis]